MTHKKSAAALAIAGLAVAAAPAAAHTVTLDVSCERARFVYADNARGEQRSTETITVDGAQIYSAPRVWTTTSRTDTFDVPLQLHGARVVTGTIVFTGSDGYRYTRTVTRSVDCPPEPVPPTPPEPTPDPTPPQPVPTPTPEPVPPTPPANDRPPVKKPPAKQLPRPTVCKRYATRPAHSVTRGVPRVGQIRVRHVAGRGWFGFRGDRFERVVVRAADGKQRRVVVFVAGEFCGPVIPRGVTG